MERRCTPQRESDEDLGRLEKVRTDPSAITGDPEDLVSIDWSERWYATGSLDL